PEGFWDANPFPHVRPFHCAECPTSCFRIPVENTRWRSGRRQSMRCARPRLLSKQSRLRRLCVPHRGGWLSERGRPGPARAVGLETSLADRLDRVEGLVNVPEGMTAPLKRIRLHAARPQGVNEPRAEGIAGAEEMLHLLGSAGPEDVAVCLLSGGGSALL